MSASLTVTSRSRRRSRTTSRRRQAFRRRMSSVNQNERNCIDLTETDDDSFVDLTTPTGPNDLSVVVLDSPAVSPPRRRARITDRIPSLELLEDDDLPEAEFARPTASTSSNRSGPSTSAGSVQSPTLSVHCPICLDDYKEIKKDGRRMATTSCGHIFCDTCIPDAIRATKCCPVCRKSLTKKQVYTLHL